MTYCITFESVSTCYHQYALSDFVIQWIFLSFFLSIPLLLYPVASSSSYLLYCTNVLFEFEFFFVLMLFAFRICITS